MKKENIGFIGSGNMAGSLIKGLISDDYPAENIWISDPDEAKLERFRKQFGVNTFVENSKLVESVSILVLAVKPQILQPVLKEIAATASRNKPLIISIAAGIRIVDIDKWLGSNAAIVRCMPNTPALVGSGATALFANKGANADQRDQAESIMRSVGLIVWIDDENLIDVVTAVSGSGPAYFFLMMEAMEAVAIKMGLSKKTARLLVQQTAFGAAKLAIEAAESPAELRHRVTSPGGTTEQAINSFEENNFSQLVEKALMAAKTRSIKLSDKLGGAS